MAEEHVRVLMQARESFVRKRREMAEQMVPDGAAAAHFGPSFKDLQDAIEAIDRAIEDEVRLIGTGAATGSDKEPPPAQMQTDQTNDNVVEVDFET